MATIPRPYTKKVELYNPQRSAAMGRRQALLEELAPSMRYKAGATSPVSEMLYSSPSYASSLSEEIPFGGYFEGGPGDGSSSSMATALAPNAPPMGFNPVSTIAALALGGPAGVAKGFIADALAQAGKAIDATVFGGQVSGALTKGAHDVASALGFPSAFGMSQGAFGKSGASTDLGHIGTPESPLAPDMAPPSSLADIGLGGGGGYDGGGYGMPGGVGVGGPW